MLCCVFFFQAEDGIRDLVRSRGLGDVYKRQAEARVGTEFAPHLIGDHLQKRRVRRQRCGDFVVICLLYTSDAADERSSVDLGGRRIIKKKKKQK